MTDPARQTKRRYAHELYPHAEEGEVRPLADEIPYLYAMALGLDIGDTGFTEAPPELLGERLMRFIQARRMALLADAIHQGMTGDEAWKWAMRRDDLEGEWVGDRADHYGVNWQAIKPYPCGPEPKDHWHPTGKASAEVFGEVVMLERADGPESECEQCTKPVAEET